MCFTPLNFGNIFRISRMGILYNSQRMFKKARKKLPPAIFKNEQTSKNKSEKFQQASSSLHFRQMAMNCCFLHYSRMFKQCAKAEKPRCEMYLSFSIARKQFLAAGPSFLANRLFIFPHII